MVKLDFDELIIKYLKQNNNHTRKIGRYYPSEVGSCMRKIFYGFHIPKEKNDELLKVFAMGDLIHNFVSEVIKSDKTNSDVHFVATELPFLMEQNGYVISGRLDNLFIVRSGTKLMILEVKSTKSIEYIVKDKKPNDSHKAQLQLYLHAMGLKEGAILYVEKNTLNTAIFHMEYSEEEAKKILDKFDEVHKNLTEHTLPKAEAKENYSTKWQCAYCEFRDECNQDLLPRNLNQSSEDICSTQSQVG